MVRSFRRNGTKHYGASSSRERHDHARRQRCNRNSPWSRQVRFDMICEANGIEPRPTKPNHLWTNGQVERMNRTIKDATVKRFHYEGHAQLRTRLAEFIAAHNSARRLKTLDGLTPYECVCKIWTSEPDRFSVGKTCAAALRMASVTLSRRQVQMQTSI